MNTVLTPLSQPGDAPSAPNAVARRAAVVVEDKITIPGWINSLDDYRRWVESDAYPENGWVSYLDGTIWVDANMEEFLTHNQVKQAFNGMFHSLLLQIPTGRFVPDRMLLVNETANLSTEPDGLYYHWATMQSGNLRLIPGQNVGYMRLAGTPDAILEIVSDGSEVKDRETLRTLYWKAQIPEYWLVDARSEGIRFEIFRHANDGYEPSATVDGWMRSDVLGHSFRLERTTDPLGLAQYEVRVKT